MSRFVKQVETVVVSIDEEHEFVLIRTPEDAARLPLNVDQIEPLIIGLKELLNHVKEEE